MRENQVLATILRLGRGAARLFRVNVGQAWTGSRVDRLPGGKVLIHDARPFRTGVPPGYSDATGWHSVEITPDMVGRRVAVFVALECKSDTGRPTREQLAFIAAVRAAGGIAGICRSSEEAEALLQAGPAGAINAPTAPIERQNQGAPT